ncbi:hypothetical protein CAOG_00584 [Capsaspora owczarzaki ATCC 30864]|uniref:RING-type domain-containing protein n=1 Tax=Capsaspora owczarzaki (strain ATCC 30864) TaxID=595528 RepID=A0A0D2WHE1_CAPO3|nr:hypothetical protein CAOG_00584 [Capsaspora owczarzaki ATCC 30864]KJE89025.1 hypothetical protein CAOG_000584 [Capsaspora owczarzaki ATCC 30864]|eukprot:XP_004365455.1 hypothetical protein CAOG_00584 [Capsaspora owczarzaki ATCC 30864]
MQSSPGVSSSSAASASGSAPHSQTSKLAFIRDAVASMLRTTTPANQLADLRCVLQELLQDVDRHARRNNVSPWPPHSLLSAAPRAPAPMPPPPPLRTHASAPAATTCVPMKLYQNDDMDDDDDDGPGLTDRRMGGAAFGTAQAQAQAVPSAPIYASLDDDSSYELVDGDFLQSCCNHHVQRQHDDEQSLALARQLDAQYRREEEDSWALAQRLQEQEEQEDRARAAREHRLAEAKSLEFVRQLQEQEEAEACWRKQQEQASADAARRVAEEDRRRAADNMRNKAQNEKFLESVQQGYARCPNAACGQIFECIPGARHEGEADQQNPAFVPKWTESPEVVAGHWRQHRFRCIACNTEFCSSCHQSPYHTGFTCEGLKQHDAAVKCRYCGRAVAGYVSGIPCCDTPECSEKKTRACTKSLPCGHACYGVLNEAQCMPCLEPGCGAHVASGVNQNGQDDCSLCYAEPLAQAPCIRNACGHVFHHACLVQQISAGHSGKRIVFTYLKCPQCPKLISHPALEAQLKPHMELYELIKQKALVRMDHDNDIPDRAGLSEEEKVKRALASYSYYKCFKCPSWYYGGRVECGENADAPFNPEELVCAGCSTAGLSNCPTHGAEYIGFKCKFCCERLSTFFCAGTTHFCEPCHRAGFGAPVKPCRGAPHCLLGPNHIPNGQEYAVGCALCSNLQH